MNFTKILDCILSIAIKITAVMLVLFVVFQVVLGIKNYTYILLEILGSSDFHQQMIIISEYNIKFLHYVATLVILVKAYKILISYSKYHHIDVKYITEIAIIGGVLELLFNSSSYSSVMQIVFLLLALGGLLIYRFVFGKVNNE